MADSRSIQKNRMSWSDLQALHTKPSTLKPTNKRASIRVLGDTSRNRMIPSSTFSTAVREDSNQIPRPPTPTSKMRDRLERKNHLLRSRSSGKQTTASGAVPVRNKKSPTLFASKEFVDLSVFGCRDQMMKTTIQSRTSKKTVESMQPSNGAEMAEPFKTNPAAERQKPSLSTLNKARKKKEISASNLLMDLSRETECILPTPSSRRIPTTLSIPHKTLGLTKRVENEQISSGKVDLRTPMTNRRPNSPFARLATPTQNDDHARPNPRIRATRTTALLMRMISPEKSQEAESKDCSALGSGKENKKNLTVETPGKMKQQIVSKSLATKPSVPSPIGRQKARRTTTLKPNETRRNLDKRTARLRHFDYFASAIATCRDHNSPGITQSITDEMDLHSRSQNGVSVFVRKRPLFDYEADRGDFDVVFAESGADSDQVIVHDCQMHADMQKQLIKQVSFQCTAAFDERTTNQDLYRKVAQPLVQSATCGKLATIVMYGQTGSGKSYTMTGIEERAANDLFSSSPLNSQIHIQFVELAGKTCIDLFDGDEVKILDQPDGSVRLINASSRKVRTPEELSRVIAEGKCNRATEATDKNRVSSRSHSVCQITITMDDGGRGVLLLIDCAGSERRNDSLYHDCSRQKESTQINASLWALKECIRARLGSQTTAMVIPYRSSNLTRILKESMERVDAQLTVIATVAPNATDTEHTLETLKTASSLMGVGSKTRKPPRVVAERRHLTEDLDLVAPKDWSSEQLRAWMASKKLEGKTNKKNGKDAMRMNAIQLRNAFYDDNEDEKANRLYRALRAENDNVARLQLRRRLNIAAS